jgi:glycerol uptake facilitator-like aquaporin
MLAKSLTALFTVGVAYGMGIVVALVCCTATSGGHFSPAVTLVHVLFNGFPPTKAVRLAKVFLRMEVRG